MCLVFIAARQNWEIFVVVIFVTKKKTEVYKLQFGLQNAMANMVFNWIFVLLLFIFGFECIRFLNNRYDASSSMVPATDRNVPFLGI